MKTAMRTNQKRPRGFTLLEMMVGLTIVGMMLVAGMPSFTTFLIGWALQGAYVIWLPMEVAIVYRRTAGSGRQNLLTRRAAGILVGALELAVSDAPLDDVLDRFLGAIGDHDGARTAGHPPAGHRGADASPAARDDRYPVRDLHGRAP